MNIELLDLLAAAAGGAVGAIFGALIAFIYTGAMVLVGIAALVGSGNPELLNGIAFGPFFGPHISFAGGVAAVAYAARRGYMSGGRDIVKPLVSLAKPDVVLVGAVFGILGYLIRELIVAIPWFGSHTDAVALTVVISAIIVRLVFGRTGIIGTHVDRARGFRRFTPNAQHVWLAYQQSAGMVAVLGVFLGAISAWAAVTLLASYPNASGVIYLGFGISAFSLLFLAFGIEVPATHHITLVSAVGVAAVVAAFPQLDPVWAIPIGALIGAVTAFVGEGFSRFWLIRGDTHIDPPASAIWPMTTIVLSVVAVISP